IALASLTALHLAVTTQQPEAVKLHLDAGANVNAQDVRGMTPLMLAIGTDRADPRIVKMLLDKGADPKIQSKAGETAPDWARKQRHPEISKMLGVTLQASAPAMQNAADALKPTARQAVEKSLGLVQKTSGTFFAAGGCVACHAQNLSAMAAHVARSNGFK